MQIYRVWFHPTTLSLRGEKTHLNIGGLKTGTSSIESNHHTVFAQATFMIFSKHLHEKGRKGERTKENIAATIMILPWMELSLDFL